MPKRLTDTDKWRDPWFRRLSPAVKLLWVFLCDECDHAGIWKVDRESAEWYVGMPIPWPEADDALKDRVEKRGGDYWFIKKFIPFQYGKTACFAGAAKSAVGRAVEMGFKGSLGGVMGESLDSPGGVKDKDKAKDKSLGVSFGKKKGAGERKGFIPPIPREATDYAKSVGFELDGEHFCNYYEARGWRFKGGDRIKDWKACVRTWKKNDQEDHGGDNGSKSPVDYRAKAEQARANLKAERLREQAPAGEVSGSGRDRADVQTARGDPDRRER